MRFSLSDVVRATERLLGTIARLSIARPAWTTLFVFLISVAATISARRLTLDSDLSALLPDSFESVQDLKRLKDVFGGIGYVVVVAQHIEQPQIERLFGELAPKIETLPTISWVNYRRETEFFQRHALYYLDTADLKEIERRLDARRTYERLKHNPLYVGLDDSDEPSTSFADILEKYKSRPQSRWVKTADIAGTGMTTDYYFDEGRQFGVLFAKPSSVSIDLQFSQRVIADVTAVVSSIDLTRYGEQAKIVLGGGYVKKVDQNNMLIRDLTITTLVAVVFTITYLAFHFRRFGEVILVFAPLLIGLLWTYGAIALLLGSLNLLTAFLGAILTGLGIDQGIHLVERFGVEYRRRREFHQAIRDTFSETGRAVIIAAITTMAAFWGIGLSEFKAFREFGIVGTIGLTLVTLSYSTILPWLLHLFSRFGLLAVRGNQSHDHATVYRWLLRSKGVGFVVSAAIVFGMSLYSMRLPFDFNSRSILASDLPSFRLDTDIDRILGYSQTPVVVLTEDEKDEKTVIDELLRRKEALGEASAIDFVAGVSDLIPTQQDAKHRVLVRIAEILGDIRPQWLKAADRERLITYQEMSRQRPFGREDLPLSVRRSFGRDSQGHDESFVSIFPSKDLSHGRTVLEFSREVRDLPLSNGGKVSAAGETMILADIFQKIISEAPPVLSFTLIIVFVVMWGMIGRFWLAVICLASGLLTLTSTFGLLSLIGMSLNYMNVVVIPVLFGVGVDGATHIICRRQTTSDPAAAYSEVGRGIVGSLTTSALGFSALLLAEHHGLSSLGRLAVVGLAVNLMVSLLFVPAALTVIGERLGRRIGLP